MMQLGLRAYKRIAPLEVTMMRPEDLLWRVIEITIILFVLGWLLVQWFGAEEGSQLPAVLEGYLSVLGEQV